MDLVKALTAAEVAKTRLPFLYQETSFIELEALQRPKDGDKEEAVEDPKVPKTRSGIKIILSRVPFEVENHVGYQKPKPRTFMTQPRQKVIEAPVVEEKTTRKPKRSAPKEKSEKIKVEKESLKKEVPEFKTDKGYKKKVATQKKPDTRERPGTSRMDWSREADYWAEFDPYHRRPVEYREDEYMRGPVRGHRGNSERRPFRGSRPMREYESDYYQRMPPRYARAPRGEGGPDRPGYYAGNRPFKMDRSQRYALEDDTSRTFKKPSREVKK